jgi:hypothetical protein
MDRSYFTQPNDDERNAGGVDALDVVPRQHAESARINGHGFVQAELGGKINRGSRTENTCVGVTPGILLRQILLHAPIGATDAAVQDLLIDPPIQFMEGKFRE